MKTYIRKATGMVALVATCMVLVFSCKNEEEPGTTIDGQPGDISFEIETSQLSTPGGRALEAGPCELREGALIRVQVRNEGGETFGATLSIRAFDDGKLIQTSPMQLPTPGGEPTRYCITLFEVYDAQGNLIAMLPDENSAMALFVDQDRCFVLRPFEKPRKRIEVLCANFDEFLPEEVGFQLFDLSLVKKQRLCIFADQCDPIKGDHVARLMVRIQDANGIVVAEGMNFTEEPNPNTAVFGGMICIFVPDRMDIPNDQEFVDVIIKIGSGDDVVVIIVRLTIAQILQLQADNPEDPNETQFLFLELDCDEPGVIIINPGGVDPRPCPDDNPNCDFGGGTDPNELPDLVVTDIRLRPNSYSCPNGQGSCTGIFDVTVRNDGTAAAGASTLAVAFDPGQSNTTTVAVPALAPSAATTIAVTMPVGDNCFDPDCTICAEADTDDDVAESDETNNEFCDTILG